MTNKVCVTMQPRLLHRYIVRSLLGQGTFGQVVECTRIGPEGLTEQVAVKVIKNQSAYFNQVERGRLGSARHFSTGHDLCHAI